MHIPLCLQGVPHLVNAFESKCIGRLLPDNFGIGHALLHTAHEGIHRGRILLGFCGKVTKLKKVPPTEVSAFFVSAHFPLLVM